MENRENWAEEGRVREGKWREKGEGIEIILRKRERKSAVVAVVEGKETMGMRADSGTGRKGTFSELLPFPSFDPHCALYLIFFFFFFFSFNN
ncbi:hypothetical protein V6N12_030167 [Hibiscus sabdariffa]|uniref:Uncharacterized protein n=1 Tax=Hibiscus sabdariffa TaxID=183260 RepID=A0ABR2C044_9ROSI